MIRFDAWCACSWHVFGAESRRIGSTLGSDIGSALGPYAEIAEHGEAGVAGLLRVELQAEDRAALDDAGERVRPGRRRRRRRLADRRRERVREVGLRPRRDAGQDRRRPRRVHGVPADVRHLELGPALGREHAPSRSHSGPSLPQRPGSSPSPGRPGASVLPSNRNCSPRQMPRSGLPPRACARIASRQGPSSTAVASKWPTPGTIRPSAPAICDGSLRREHLGAGRGQRLAHRRQVAGAIVDQRDLHSVRAGPWCWAASSSTACPSSRRRAAPARTP